MRMWLGVEPSEMCRKHLLGEHVELHMLAGCVLHGKSIKGFINKGLICAYRARERHIAISREMTMRGYRHGSNLHDDFLSDDILTTDNTLKGCVMPDVISRNRADLAAHCPECAERMKKNEKV